MENSTETIAEEESSISLLQCMILLCYNLTGAGVLAKSLAMCEDVGSQAVGSPALSIVTILFGLAIIVPNMLIVFGIVKGHVLHKPMYYLIGNMAVVDTLAGAVCISLPLLLRSDGAQSPIQALYTTLFFTLYLSLLGITVLSIDRYVSIHYGLFYSTTITGRHAAAAVIITWLGSALLCYSVMLGWNCQNLGIRAERCVGQLDGNYIILLTAVIFIVMLIVIQTNVSIYLVIKRRLQALVDGQLGANADAQHISSAKKKATVL
ncbi:sphingosine 1-phosphate receptor 1-like [Branchiostoma lanceolatum]|uniref:sphingosine 1-phosphate receptor 1-like n=1 Tax=Branchiostoma lanceolatum TaxID=7740 RepID=UPI003453C0FD